MFYSLTSVGCCHCVQKERPRRKIDNWCGGDAHGIKFGVAEIPCGHWRANVTLPNNAAIEGIERIHVIHFSHGNDHRFATWAVLDVKRLRVDGAFDCAVKVQVARQIRGGPQSEGRVNVETVSRIVVMKLRHVHLRACGRSRPKNSKAKSSNDKRANW